jgi:hypothetical protein
MEENGATPEEIEAFYKRGFKDIEIEFRINGVDADFLSIMYRMEEQFDRMVREKAIELIDENNDEISMMLNSFKAKLAQKLGVEIDDPYYGE